MAVVQRVNQGSSRNLEAMHLLRYLAFLAAKFGFYLFSSHLRGVKSSLADALSRKNLQKFLASFLQANPTLSHNIRQFCSTEEAANLTCPEVVRDEDDQDQDEDQSPPTKRKKQGRDISAKQVRASKSQIRESVVIVTKLATRKLYMEKSLALNYCGDCG